MRRTLTLEVDLSSLDSRRALFRYAEALEDANPEESRRVYAVLSELVTSMLRMEGNLNQWALAEVLGLVNNPPDECLRNCENHYHDWKESDKIMVCKNCGVTRIATWQ